MVSRRDVIENNNIALPPTILDITRTHQQTLNWLLQNNLLSRTKNCLDENCDGEMHWINDISRADGVIMICSTCAATSTIRRDTVFYNSKLSLMEITRIIFHLFANHITIRECSRTMGIGRRSVAKIYAKVRSAISWYVLDVLQGDNLLGVEPQTGANVPEEHEYPVVEVDESLFSHTSDN